MAVYPTMSKKQRLKSRQFTCGLILTIVFSILLLNLFFNFFNIFSNIIRGCIGLLSYPICAFFVLVGILKLLDVKLKVTKKIVVLIAIWLVIFITIIQIPTSAHLFSSNYFDYIVNTFRYGMTAGGVIFSSILYPIYLLLGMVGSYVIFAILLIITSTVAIDKAYLYYKYTNLIKSSKVAESNNVLEDNIIETDEDETTYEEFDDELEPEYEDNDLFISDEDDEEELTEKEKARNILNLTKTTDVYENRNKLDKSDIFTTDEEVEEDDMVDNTYSNDELDDDIIEPQYVEDYQNAGRKIFIHEANTESIYANAKSNNVSKKPIDYRSALEDIKKDAEKEDKKKAALEYLGVSQGKFDRSTSPIGSTVIDNVTKPTRTSNVSNVKQSERVNTQHSDYPISNTNTYTSSTSKLQDYINNHGKPNHNIVNDPEEKTYDIYDDQLTKKTFKQNEEQYINKINKFDTVVSNMPKKAQEVYTAEEKSTRVEAQTIKGGKQLTINDIAPKPKPRPSLNKPYRYNPPPIDLLKEPPPKSDAEVENTKIVAQSIIDIYAQFKLDVNLVGCSIGPTFTRYEFQLLTPGVKINTVKNYDDNLKYVLGKQMIRMQVPIPGKSAFGIEVPNDVRDTVYLRSLIESNEFRNAKSPLTCAIGQDISGKCITANISKLIHTLMAGTSGSGKSVCLNTLLASLLYKASPEDVRFLIVDPKSNEFTAFNNLPHMLVPKPIITIENALLALEWLIKEMERRYAKFSKFYVKNIDEYNELPEVTSHEESKMYSIILLFDEVADYMSQAKKEIDDKIKRLAAKARAAGIYLILATQRPTTDVITGTIKANMSSRIALMVKTYIDSKTILDDSGAEYLLGNGDMIFAPYGGQNTRVQGGFVSRNEMLSILKYVKENNEARFDPEIEEEMFRPDDSNNGGFNSSDPNSMEFDPMLKDCLKFFIKSKRCSATSLQTYFGIGWPKASKIVLQMEKAGFVGKDGGGKSILFITEQEFEERFGESIDD